MLECEKKCSPLKKILPFFSYAFHPIFISLFAVVFYFGVSTDYYAYESIYLYLLQTLLVTVFIPLAIFYLLVSLKKIDTVMVANVKQRKIPLVGHIVLLAFLVLKTFRLDNFPELFYFFLGSIISTFFALLLTYWKKKISLHMLGMSSFTIFCHACSMHFGVKPILFLSVLWLCNGLVASSRLYMKAHTPAELMQGYAIGSVPPILLLFFWL